MKNEFTYRGHEVKILSRENVSGGSSFQVYIDGDYEPDISGLPFGEAVKEATRLVNWHESAIEDAVGSTVRQRDIENAKIPKDIPF